MVVASWDCVTDVDGNPTTDIAEYQLSVDNASGISELEDDITLTEATRAYALTVSGSATLTPASR